MAEYLIQSETLDAIADAINAKTGGSSAMTPAEMVTEIGSIQTGGGTTITDGIVVKARDANGYATEVDFYGATVQPFQFFGQNATNSAWKALSKINWKDTVTAAKQNAFNYANLLTELPSTFESAESSACANMAGITSINMPNLLTVNTSSFYGMSSARSIYLPKVTNFGYNNILGGNLALETAQLGSVGYGVTNISTNCFSRDTQSGLIITIFTDGSHVDTLLSRVRNSATNATIIIKASEATTYNGISYAAGDTILTSEVTA